MTIDQEVIVAKAASLLQDQGVAAAPPTAEHIVPDGSTRSFLRLSFNEQKVVCVLPPPGDPNGDAEAQSFYAIGRHLEKRGVAVPAILGVDDSSNMVVCEDLGDTRLHDLLVEKNGATQDVTSLYEQAVQVLAHMQVAGAENFELGWCWDTPCYDTQIMVEKESGYFLRAFCTDYLQLTYDQEALAVDCLTLAQKAGQAPNQFFLHRDFQSRNIMVKDGQVRVIDFQGGRLGPLAYDLASLLIDPYAALDGQTREHLVATYLDALQAQVRYDGKQFRQELLMLSMQRNLQIIGAFAFLTRVRKKPFFQQFLRPALASLIKLLEHPENDEYPALHALCKRCEAQLNSK